MKNGRKHFALAIGIVTSLMGWTATYSDLPAFYISPDGDDRGSGTAEEPFISLEAARDAIRALRERAPDAFRGAEVVLREGRYFRRQSFRLEARDSGLPDAPVTYRAANGERVILDGGYIVSGHLFKPVTDPEMRERLLPDARDRVLKLDLRALDIHEYGQFGPRGWGRPDIHPPMELFLDGIPQRVARWPNEGSIPLGEVLKSGVQVPTSTLGEDPDSGDASKSRNAVFRYNTDRATRWTQADDLFISGLFGVTWAHDTIRIATIDLEEEVFITDGPHHYGFHQPGRPANFETHYHAVNLLEEIELPGEYFIDRTNGALYFLPPYPLDDSLIQLSALAQPFFHLDGASHIHIRGLWMENARDRGVVIRDGTENLIVGCTIRALGQQAIDLQGGQAHRVESSDIYYTGRGGISLSGGDRRKLVPSRHVVYNCDIHRFNRWIRFYNPGVSARGVGARLAHNHIHHSLHQAIVFSGNDHVIEKNEIHHVLLDISDMGSIYIGRNPTFAGNHIRYNFFHHLFHPHQRGPGVQAIFLDDDTIFAAQIFGNVFYRAGSSGVIKFHGGGGASIANNISIAGPQLVQDGPGTEAGMARALSKMHTDQPHGHGFPKMLEEMNISEPPFRTRYPYLYETYAGLFHPYRIDPEDPEAGARAPRWNNFETDVHGDHFEDPEQLDFRLRPDSPLFDGVATGVVDRIQGADGDDIPFAPIPFEKMGLVAGPDRPALGPRAFEKLGPRNEAKLTAAEADVQCWWAPSHGADFYRVIFATDAAMQDVVLVREVETNHLIVDELNPGGTYYWEVEAVISRSRSNRGTRRADGAPWSFHVGSP